MSNTDRTPAITDPSRMPTWFVPHGAGPCFFMDWNPPQAWQPMANFLKGLASTLAQTPKAIVMVSAHWQEASFQVSSAAHPALVYDYYGFPPHTYELKYPAPGAPHLAAQITELLQEAKLPAQANATQGFDHGMFIPLMLMFPQANIPVVQLSLRNDLDPLVHLQAGQALKTLRAQGVLIAGSGMSFHNMRGYGDPRFGPISDEFDTWLTGAVEAEPQLRHQALINWVQAPSARLSHPPRAEEHLLPLMLVAGAAGADKGRRMFSDRVLETTLSAYSFG